MTVTENDRSPHIEVSGRFWYARHELILMGVSP